MKKFFLVILFHISLFANVSLDNIFNISVLNNNGFQINIKLDESVYLYKKEIKVILNNQDITEYIDLPNAVLKDDIYVYFNNLFVYIPKELLKDTNKLLVYYQGCSNEGLCYQPLLSGFEINKDNYKIIYKNVLAYKVKKDEFFIVSNNYVIDYDFIFMLLKSFAYGFLLSLTPCTLPMIPILSSILVKSVRFNPVITSIVYVLGMSLAYTIFGVIAAMFGHGLQSIFQHKITIIIFALIFVLLSLSMFGLYSIKIPDKLANQINSKINVINGIGGAFLMGFLSSLIVGPCVGAPLAGILVYIASTNDVLLGGASLFLMSIGMGIPLIVLGFGFKVFKTGPWMLYVNKLFGFILLIIAIYFLERICNEFIINILYLIVGIAFLFYFGLFKSIKKRQDYIVKFVLIAVVSIYLKVFFVIPNDGNNQLKFNLAKDELILKDGVNVLYFTAQWCENCKELQYKTFTDEQVIKELSKYNLIKIDLTNPNDFEQKIASEYQIFGPPVLIFLDKDKTIKKQIIGYVDSKSFLKELKEL